jgi:iron-sulfur cluster repair protein YtfE (RIC family)
VEAACLLPVFLPVRPHPAAIVSARDEHTIHPDAPHPIQRRRRDHERQARHDADVCDAQRALLRELEHIAKITARIDDDPRRIFASAAGWAMFKKALHIHHSAEDDALWPAMRQALVGRPDDLALVEAMEAEHAAIDPLIEAIDAALADRDSGPERVGDRTDALASALSRHLKHEEDEACH